MSGSFHLSDGYDPNKSNATTPTKMSNEKNDGGQAFPMQYSTRKRCDTQDGMTLRDYFAAKAMEGMISGDTKMRGSELILSLPSHLGALSKTAYGIADAMLKAREE